MRRTRIAMALAVAGSATVTPLALGGGPARAAGPDGVIAASAESFGMRLEYDIPLPVGSGTVAHVNGEVRRSGAGENAKGVAGAPSELDAVVSGKYIDPNGTGHPQRNLPQTECFYPGTLLVTSFFFPTDTQPESKTAPPTGYANARCGAGPEVELHAVSGSTGTKGSLSEAFGAVVTSGSVASDALARPDKGALVSDTQSRGSGFSVLGGVVKIGSVQATGHSNTSGAPGSGRSDALVSVSDVDAGGVVFSLASASRNGKEQVEVTAAGQTVPVDSSAGKQVIDTANAAIKANGCSLTPLTTPDTYPQGFLFSRKPPEVGVRPDGTLAASYRGGLLVTCDVPETVSGPTTFTPQRAQMLFGFAYTSTAATTEVGGFGLGNLGGSGLGGGGGPLLGGVTTPSGGAGPAGLTPATAGGGAPPAALGGLPTTSATPPADPASAGTTEAALAPPPTGGGARPSTVAAIRPFHMSGSSRLLLGLLALVAWGWLTNLGARRFLVATNPCVARPDERTS